MEAVRHWALTLSICCVLAAMLQMMLPAKGAGKVIKTVLTLYILLTAAAPMPGIDWTEFSWQLRQRPVSPAFDPDALRQTAFSAALEQSLGETLHRSGIRAEVKVQTGPEGPAGVTLYMDDLTREAEARALLTEQLGSGFAVSCEAKDGVP